MDHRIHRLDSTALLKKLRAGEVNDSSCDVGTIVNTYVDRCLGSDKIVGLNKSFHCTNREA